MMNARLTIVGLLVAAGVMVTGQSAWGQYALGNGQRLDNSLQAGSRGLNSAKVTNTYGNAQNALVTGNVSGLGGFRGDLGYRAPGEFTGTISGDLVYRFQAQSAGRGLTSNMRRIDSRYSQFGDYTPAWQSGGGSTQTVIRPGGGATAGDISGYGSYLQTGPAATYRTETSAGQLTQQSVLNRSTATAAANYRIAANRAGIPNNAGGDVLRVQAQQDLRLNRFLPTLQDVSGGHAEYATIQRRNRLPQGVQGPDFGEVEYYQANTDLALQPLEANPALRGQAELTPITGSLGERIGDQMRLVETGGISDNARQTTQRIDRSIDQLLGSRSVEPGTDVYMDLLRKIRGEEDDETAATLNQLGAQRPAQESAATGQQTGPLDVPTYSMTDEPEGQVISVRPAAGAAQAEQGEDADTQDDSLDAIVEKLRYDMKPLETMAGGNQTLLDGAMSRAEKHMAEGRYFDADMAYVEAMSYKPGHPLARAGRVNAQLGAGLYTTAARSLHTLLSAHPELIAARYSEPVLPPIERLEIVRNRLLQLLGTNEDATDSALLLAYISYQTGDRQGCVDALNTLQERRPDDRLAPLLKRIWTAPANPNSESLPTAP